MLRRLLLAAAGSDRLHRLATTAPAARAVAHRFVAGETLEDALRVVADLNASGRGAALDHLGEAVEDPDVAEQALEIYRQALRAVADRHLDCSVSVKLTQLGLLIDRERCRGLVAAIASAAADAGTHVTVDMESSAVTDATLDLVTELRADGHRNVGCAVQSYLHRTPADVRRLVADGASLRLCKGAYDEPDAVAYQDGRAIDSAYLELAETLLDSGTFPRFATHDHRLIRRVRDLARRRTVPDDAFEFQQLFGIREPLQRELVENGHHVRVYVPFGSHWYPYLVRRLAERPANLAFFVRALAGSSPRPQEQAT